MVEVTQEQLQHMLDNAVQAVLSRMPPQQRGPQGPPGSQGQPGTDVANNLGDILNA